MRVWRMELERRWEEERRRLIADNGGVVPVIDSFEQIPLLYDGDDAERAG